MLEKYQSFSLLGDSYRDSNINQSYLCYEQALFYCEKKEERQRLKKNMKELMSLKGFEVSPVSIVILSYNSRDIMMGCVESIRENCLEDSYEIVVVDNASTDGIVEWLKEQEDIVLQCNEENKSFAEGCNQGIGMAATGNDILLLNNDTIVPADALFWLRLGLYERETVGATGPMTSCAGNHQQVEEACASIEEYLELAEKIHTPMDNAYENKIFLVGFAELIKRRVLDEVGLLDVDFLYGGYEDTDYGIRVTKAGYELLLCHNAFIYHYGSLNMSKDEGKYSYHMKKNSVKFVEKWGFSEWHYSDIEEELIEKIEQEPDAHMHLLEIGCGYGASLSRVRWQYPNAQVYGVEVSSSVAGCGTYMGNILSGDIDRMDLPYEKQFFDYLLLGNSLEQMYTPKETLLSLKEYLKPGGKLLAKVYNIMNISVLAPLLRGQFQYIDFGILNEKNCHFFTFSELAELFGACGFQNIQFDILQGIEVMRMMEEDKFLAQELYRVLGITDETLFDTYYFLIEAEA